MRVISNGSARLRALIVKVVTPPIVETLIGRDRGSSIIVPILSEERADQRDQ